MHVENQSILNINSIVFFIPVCNFKALPTIIVQPFFNVVDDGSTNIGNEPFECCLHKNNFCLKILWSHDLKGPLLINYF